MKKLYVLIVASILFALSNKTAAQTNLIANGSFDTPVYTQQQSQIIEGEWRYVGGWNSQDASVQYLTSGGVDNSPCISINGGSSTVDVRFAQKITELDPTLCYICTAKIKIVDVQGGAGARISHNESWQQGILGTADWQTYTLDYSFIESGTAEVWLRLGGYSATSSGTVYFDEITFTENTNKYINTSEHFRLIINQSEKSITDTQIDTWLSNLDIMYEQYRDLMCGLVPYDGKISIYSVADIPAWAWTTSTQEFGIQWNSDYIASTLLQIATYGDWCFGIMHEIGHNFGSIGTHNNAYNWDEEMFANMRMYLALIKTNGTARMNNYNYVGAEIAEFYHNTFTNNGLINNDGKLNGDACQYTLCRLGNAYQQNDDHGYQLFKCAFEYIFSNSAPIDSDNWNDWQRFSYFMDVLSQCAGEDVRTTFSQDELTSIQIALGGGTNSINNIKRSNIVTYPNPAKDILYISGATDNSNVIILDLIGRECFNGKPRDKSINISSLPNGLYLLKIGNSIAKFVKE